MKILRHSSFVLLVYFVVKLLIGSVLSGSGDDLGIRILPLKKAVHFITDIYCGFFGEVGSHGKAQGLFRNGS